MNLKNVAGKTVFFVLICLFVALYSTAFGQENSLTGVVVVVLALMNLFPMVSAGSMAEGAAIYLLGAIVGALLGVYMVTRKRPLELLQVKE